MDNLKIREIKVFVKYVQPSKGFQLSPVSHINTFEEIIF